MCTGLQLKPPLESVDWTISPHITDLNGDYLLPDVFAASTKSIVSAQQLHYPGNTSLLVFLKPKSNNGDPGTEQNYEFTRLCTMPATENVRSQFHHFRIQSSNSRLSVVAAVTFHAGSAVLDVPDDNASTQNTVSVSSPPKKRCRSCASC